MTKEVTIIRTGATLISATSKMSVQFILLINARIGFKFNFFFRTSSSAFALFQVSCFRRFRLFRTWIVRVVCVAGNRKRRRRSASCCASVLASCRRNRTFRLDWLGFALWKKSKPQNGIECSGQAIVEVTFPTFHDLQYADLSSDLYSSYLE